MSKVMLIDPRWGNDVQRRLDKTLAELVALGYSPVVRQMVTGDVVWGSPLGRIGVEMKCLRDLLESHRIGRLDDELYRLQKDFAVPVLLITETYSYGADIPDVGGFSFESMDNLLVGRQLRGILVARCSELGIAERLHRLYAYFDRPAQRMIRPKKGFHMPYMGKLTERAEVIYALLATVKGIRDKAVIAEKLAAMPLSKVFTLSETGWREQGFTKTMAKRLADLLTEV